MIKDFKIRQNVPLAPLTTFKIGGPAKYFAEAGTEEELLEAVSYAKKNRLDFFVLSGGSNILVSDEGFDGLVIRMLDTSYKVNGTFLECGGGLPLSEAVKLAKENSLSGLEWAAGIPGSVGGAVRGNAGAYGSEICEAVESVRALEVVNQDSSEIHGGPGLKILSREECGFTYRSSIFKKDKNLIVVSCRLKLEKGNQAEIEEKMKEVVRKRSEKIPKDLSAGSFFQNPTVHDKELIAKFEQDVGCACRGNKIPAGWLIEEAGLRGKKIGGAMVSEKHANFVVNAGGAKAQDVIMLASFIKMRIRDGFGVQLREEVQFVGF